MPRLIIIVSTLLLASGCNVFDPRSGALECSQPSDCTTPRVCEQGFCVLPGTTPDANSNPADANPNPPDANPDAPDANPNAPDALPAPTCNGCVSGACAETCGAGDSCTPVCDNVACSCGFDCVGTTACAAECKFGATCDVDCSGAANCEIKCNGGSSCLLDCTGATSCDIVQCVGGAGSGLASCANNIIVCNRPCP